MMRAIFILRGYDRDVEIIDNIHIESEYLVAIDSRISFFRRKSAVL